MITLLKLAISREKDFIASCLSCDQRNNPQVIESRLKAEGRLDAFEAVLYSARGSNVLLRIFAGK